MKKLYFMILMATCAMTSSYASDPMQERPGQIKTRMRAIIRHFAKTPGAKTTEGKRLIELMKQKIKSPMGSVYSLDAILRDEEICALQRGKIACYILEYNKQNNGYLSDSNSDEDYLDLSSKEANEARINAIATSLSNFQETPQAQTESGQILVRVLQLRLSFHETTTRMKYMSQLSAFDSCQRRNSRQCGSDLKKQQAEMVQRDFPELIDSCFPEFKPIVWIRYS